MAHELSEREAGRSSRHCPLISFACETKRLFCIHYEVISTLYIHSLRSHSSPHPSKTEFLASIFLALAQKEFFIRWSLMDHELSEEGQAGWTDVVHRDDRSLPASSSRIIKNQTMFTTRPLAHDKNLFKRLFGEYILLYKRASVPFCAKASKSEAFSSLRLNILGERRGGMTGVVQWQQQKQQHQKKFGQLALKNWPKPNSAHEKEIEAFWEAFWNFYWKKLQEKSPTAYRKRKCWGHERTTKSPTAHRRDPTAQKKKMLRAWKNYEKPSRTQAKTWIKASGQFNRKWGQFLENLVKGDLVKLLAQRNIKVARVQPRLVACDSNGREIGEFDLVAINGEEIVAVEVKTTLTKEKVQKFIAQLKMFKKYFPEYANKVIYGAVAFLWVNQKAKMPEARPNIQKKTASLLLCPPEAALMSRPCQMPKTLNPRPFRGQAHS